MGCVYLATNRINGKRYVGKTIRSLCARKQSHKKCVEKGSKTAFHCAMRKYGFDAFDWEILIEEDTNRLLNRWEKWYIKKLSARPPGGYNLTAGGDGLSDPSDEVRWKCGSAFRDKKLTPEHIVKCMAAFHSPEACAKRLLAVRSAEGRARNSATHTGKKQSEESKRKKSDALMGHVVTKETRGKISVGKKGQIHTAESRAKMSTSQKGKVRSEEFKIAVGNYWRGRKRSEENREALHRWNRYRNWESCSL